uniref:Cerebellar degeneration-related protein 2-like isoform X1 n=1 Tax=Petromyzon marinus TaxID=7757 RepID=A0AAJ7TXV1_PETMA|nr:cerebellar degeneration-related protein 2-like isoform X1 [Petromyzon marinus]
METFNSSSSSAAGQERWMEQRDLERDLQLAAKLGKSLLERNKELECSLQQLYITNQDHVLEIEHLTRQLELLRENGERHAQVYEHLDVASRDLELANRRLLLEGRNSQQRIAGLSEHVEGLQAQVVELQKQLEELRRSGEASARREKRERRRTVHGVPVLHDIRRYLGTDRVSADILVSGQDGGADQRESEVQCLQRSVKSLSASLARERERCGNLDLELALALAENSDMDQRLADLEPWLERTQELEKELLEMSRIRLSEGERLQRLLATAELAAESLLNGDRGVGDMDIAKLQSLLGHPEADTGSSAGSCRELGDSCDGDKTAAHHTHGSVEEPGPTARGPVSILSEVSEQYAALQARYEDLLARMHDRSVNLQHRAVQTGSTHSVGRSREIAAAATQATAETSDAPGSWVDIGTAADCGASHGPDELPAGAGSAAAPCAEHSATRALKREARSDTPAGPRRRAASSDGSRSAGGGARGEPGERMAVAMVAQYVQRAERGEQPEYKALFQEIFMHIRKTREDICAAKALRGTPRPQHS